MRPITMLSLILAVSVGVSFGCKQKSSKATAGSTGTTPAQAAESSEAERKRLADANASLEAERKRLEDEKKNLQTELDRLKGTNPAPIPGGTPAGSAAYSCGRVSNNQVSCSEYANLDQSMAAQYQQQCAGMGGLGGLGGLGNLGGLFPGGTLPNLGGLGNMGGMGAGTWAATACSRSIQGVPAVGVCRYLLSTVASRSDVYYNPWTAAGAQQDCQTKRGVFLNP